MRATGYADARGIDLLLELVVNHSSSRHPWSEAAAAGFTTGRPGAEPATDDPAVTVAAQADDPDGPLERYRRLIALRGDHPALADGSLEVLEPAERSVLATLREGHGERLLVLLNFAPRDAAVDLDALLGASGVGGPDLLSGERMTGGTTLGRLATRIVRLDRAAR